MKQILLTIVIDFIFVFTAFSQLREDTLVVNSSLSKSIHLNISIPYLNSFEMRMNTGKVHSRGCWGIACELEFEMDQNSSISTQIGSATNIPSLFPVMDIQGELDRYSSTFLNIRYNQIYGSFGWGLGLHYSKFGWKHQDTTGLIDAEQFNYSYGICVMVHYEILRNFSTRIVYQPVVIEQGKTLFSDYQHFLSLEFLYAFKIY